LGLGPANYYWYVQQIPLRGYFVRFNSHNQYVDLVAQLGVLGLACFAWFVVEVGMLALQLRKLVSAGFAQAYVVGVLGGLAGMVVSGMLADWFFPFAYNIGLDGFRGGMLAWLFLGGLVAIERIARRNEPEQTALESSISEAPHYA
jgi:O-antigen ligase